MNHTSFLLGSLPDAFIHPGVISLQAIWIIIRKALEVQSFLRISNFTFLMFLPIIRNILLRMDVSF
jgi:hypothetical protein